MTRAIHCRSAEQNEVGIACGHQRDCIAGPEYQETARGKMLACDLDLAGDEIIRTLFHLRIEGKLAAGGKRNVGEQRLPQSLYRRTGAIDFTRDNANRLAVLL